MHDIDAKIQELGHTLPQAAAPAANYLPYRVVGNMVYISGQLPKRDGTIHNTGIVGQDVSLEQANTAAQLAGLNIIAQLKEACGGDLQRVVCCVKLGGFVQAPADFTQHPEVINGASDLMVAVFGDAGRHTRFAVGAPTLPRNTCVEIDAIFQIKA